MSSALQCLSHTFELTNYFLKKIYIQEINTVNPLGSLGEISKSYEKLLRSLWLEKNSYYVPIEFKLAID